MKITEVHLDSYMDSKRNVWAESTKKSEKSRLLSVLSVLDGDPNTLWEHCDTKNVKQYTRNTLFIRVIDFIDYLKLDNKYKDFKKQKIRFFRNAYERKDLHTDFNTAKQRISTIQNEEIRAKANDLLFTGMRFSESNTYKEGYIKGKGDKHRRVYGRVTGNSNVSYYSLYKALRALDLTPHTLRKLAATQFANAGMREADLLKVFGWSNIQTAKYYLQSKADDELESIIEGVVNNETK